MNKTFIFQKVFGSYEVVIWIVVADSMEEAFQAMSSYFQNLYKDYPDDQYYFNFSYSIEHQTPMAANSLIKGVNYDPENDVIDIDPRRVYHAVGGTYKKTKTEGWWDYKEFNSDLPKGYILFEAHDG